MKKIIYLLQSPQFLKSNRATVRSKTFEGIAKTMVEQWGE